MMLIKGLAQCLAHRRHSVLTIMISLAKEGQGSLGYTVQDVSLSWAPDHSGRCRERQICRPLGLQIQDNGGKCTVRPHQTQLGDRTSPCVISAAC